MTWLVLLSLPLLAASCPQHAPEWRPQQVHVACPCKLTLVTLAMARTLTNDTS